MITDINRVIYAAQEADSSQLDFAVHGRRVPVHLKLDHISVLNLQVAYLYST